MRQLPTIVSPALLPLPLVASIPCAIIARCRGPIHHGGCQLNGSRDCFECILILSLALVAATMSHGRSSRDAAPEIGTTVEIVRCSAVERLRRKNRTLRSRRGTEAKNALQGVDGATRRKRVEISGSHSSSPVFAWPLRRQHGRQAVTSIRRDREGRAGWSRANTRRPTQDSGASVRRIDAVRRRAPYRRLIEAGLDASCRVRS